MLRPTRPKLAMLRPTQPKDKVFDSVFWSKPISFERARPNENLIDRSPLYFDWLEKISRVSNASAKLKVFSTVIDAAEFSKKILKISVRWINQNWK